MLWRLRRHKVGKRKSVGGRGMGFEKTGKANLIRNEKYFSMYLHVSKLCSLVIITHDSPRCYSHHKQGLHV